MEDEIFTVGIIGIGPFRTIGIGDPVPVFVIDKQAMKLLQLITLGAEQTLQPGQLLRVDAFVFEAVYQGKEQRIGLFDRRLRLRRQGLRQVGHRHFFVMQVVLARGPGFPDHYRRHRQAHRHEQSHRVADLEPRRAQGGLPRRGGTGACIGIFNGRMPP